MNVTRSVPFCRGGTMGITEVVPHADGSLGLR
jgi:hypothetical protein